MDQKKTAAAILITVFVISIAAGTWYYSSIRNDRTPGVVSTTQHTLTGSSTTSTTPPPSSWVDPDTSSGASHVRRTINSTSTDPRLSSTHVVPESISIDVKETQFDSYKGLTKDFDWPIFRSMSTSSLDSINKALSFGHVTGFKDPEITVCHDGEQCNIQTTTGGLDELTYSVTYDKHSLVGLTYAMEYTGAYPTDYAMSYLVDTDKGTLVPPLSLFKTSTLDGLIRTLNNELQKRVASTLKDAGPGTDTCSKSDILQEIQGHTDYDPTYGTFTEAQFAKLGEPSKGVYASGTPYGIDISVATSGISFTYDYGFPHVTLACEPDGTVFLSYKSLRPYLDPNGPLKDEI